MENDKQFIFRIARWQTEFDQIHQLNYQTFVEEIPQHSENPDHLLVDRFHDDNIYFICLNETGQVVGMISIREKRPFSLDQKINNLDALLPRSGSICEIRLLSVKKQYRNSKVFFGLISVLAEYCMEKGFDMAIISGTDRQQKLYSHLGFKIFADPVGKPEALYYPMYLTIENALPAFVNLKKTAHLLTGPVALDERVRVEFAKPPVSHRSNEFIADFQVLRSRLCRFVQANFVEILSGSGTLANDAVAAQINQLREKGLILSNGEFGERLISQANRIGLDFVTYSVDWGKSYAYSEIEKLLDQHQEIKWIWSVHCETSTGVLNDIHQLKEISLRRNIKLCLDCISSIGTTLVDLSGVYLASCSSGKALCSFPGLSMVFYNHRISISSNISKYLDLGFYNSENGIPFTLSSNSVYALLKAVDSFSNSHDDFSSLKIHSMTIKEVMLNAGLTVINEHGNTSPALVTIELPDDISSAALGDELEKQGCIISYKSNYLIRRNWVQTFVTRNTTNEEVVTFLNVMALMLDRFESHLVTGG